MLSVSIIGCEAVYVRVSEKSGKKSIRQNIREHGGNPGIQPPCETRYPFMAALRGKISLSGFPVRHNPQIFSQWKFESGLSSPTKKNVSELHTTPSIGPESEFSPQQLSTNMSPP
jgi:hypothetical protein